MRSWISAEWLQRASRRHFPWWMFAMVTLTAGGKEHKAAQWRRGGQGRAGQRYASDASSFRLHQSGLQAACGDVGMRVQR